MTSPEIKAGEPNPDNDVKDPEKSGDIAAEQDDEITTLDVGRDDGDNSPSSGDETELEPPLGISKYDLSWIHKIMTPKKCRWNPKSPPPLTTILCLLYAISSTITVANLYYNQPILNKIAREFNVTYEESSQVATLMQAGYAAGLLFILPLGDILERRAFVISLVLFTATMWIGLCVTDDFSAFRALSFICGATTVTPQLMIPLVGDYAPAHRKAASLSIVVSGLMLGMLVARVLSGVVANFTSWRNIYWIACGAQYLLAVALFFFMPDYPSTNPDGLNYFRALWSIPYMIFTEPVLIQSCLIVFCLSCVFTSFWTTLTFLLASPPYEFSSLDIGLFSLTTLATIITIPIVGRLIDKFVPLFSILMGQVIVVIGVSIGTGIGTFVVAGPILQAIGVDFGIQTSQVANRAAIFNINPKARNRVNTAYMVSAFAGQLTGTAVGNRLYAQGGWRWSDGCSIGFISLSILVALARGPRETGWVGWKGGWRPRKDPIPAPEQLGVELGVQTKEKAHESPA
ncbi:Fc.00g061830.m01.CDS01 [Cosmosporella sp. VM-42]